MLSSKAIFSVVSLGLLLSCFDTRANATDHRAFAKDARIVRSLDRDWTFQYFPQQTPDKHWAETGVDDSKWPAVALPHTWSVYETTRDLHPFIEHATEREDSYWWYGWGWYRKHFSIAKQHEQRLVFLEFDGVQKVSFLYVNGHLAGEHKGGYNSFSLDITRWIKFGEDNVIAVQVSNRRDDNLGHVPPMTAGNFDVYGGIYRGVRLVLTSKVYVPFQGSADSEGGSFIQTPHVSAELATVHDTTWVRNDGDGRADVEVASRIQDADGNVLATQKTQVAIAPGELKSVEQDFAPVLKPHLWSPATPYLYRMVTDVREHGTVVDEYESTLGFRFFYWNKVEKRLYLNGSPIQLIGTNRHQDFPWLGDAVPVWMQIRDLKDMRYNMGFNFQRSAHYTQDPAVYDFCDRNGVIVAEESPNIKDIEFGRDVQLQMMREMIRRDRNHPSIFFWSIGNETDHPADSAWAWAEDKSRIINLRRGINGGKYVMTSEDDLALEQTLRCTIRGWYNDDAHNFYPDTGEPANGQVTGTEEWQHTTDASYLQKKRGTNIVVFLYADHGADRIYKNAPLHNINPKGWVDGFRFPKYVYYLWQANFTQKPMVFIHPWPWQQRYIGKRETITVDSNADSVELIVDGRSLGAQRPAGSDAHVVEFKNVEVTNGTIRAVAHKNAQTVEDTIEMPGAPVKLRLTVQAEHLAADRSGLALLQVDALDNKGKVVPYIHPEIDWKVFGEGKLVGPAKYTTDTDKNGAEAGTLYIALPTANILRTTGKAGEITVMVSSPGLESAEVTLHSTAAEEPESGIMQPELSDAGRVPVVRDASIVSSRSGMPPRVFEPITQDYKLPASSVAEARASMEEFLHEHNPKLANGGAAYEDALTKLSGLLADNHGNLVADWYNFTANQYEDVAALNVAIERSKLPPKTQKELERNYADRIILKGEAIDVRQEAKRLGVQ
jgi:beta-galactosidase